jgi:hypothetical protein
MRESRRDPDRDRSEPAPPTRDPSPEPMPGKSYVLVIEGVAFGRLGTLVAVNSAHDGFAYEHIFGVLVLIVMIVALERAVAMAELVWQDRIIKRDAAVTAATSARIAKLSIKPPLRRHRTRGDRSRR